MPKLKVVEGKLSNKYNHFNDYRFDSCIATDTRLMGVVAMKVSWTAKDGSRDKLFQLIHLDFSEYGVDDYREIFSNAENPEGGREVRSEWKRISGSLGGNEVKIPFFTMVQLIDEVVATNEKYYEGHELFIQDFRKETLIRLDLMKEASKKLLHKTSEFEDKSKEGQQLVCKSPLTSFELINYFLMRMLDKDYHGASFLGDVSMSEMNRSRFKEIELAELVRNKISKATTAATPTGEATVYKCRFTALSDTYIYGEALITLSPRSLTRTRRILEFEVTTLMHISNYEAALQLQQAEYITLYELTVPAEAFDLDDSVFGADATMSPAQNGIVYVIYNKDNYHVDSSNYFMNHDLYGAYLLTPNGELVVMSHDIIKITNMEADIGRSINANKLKLKGRYKLETQVFKSFSETPGAMFSEMIYSPEDNH
nr:hypothetical protein [uncultured Mogibacterium sp.]